MAMHVIMGQAGLGKSHVCAYMANEHHENGERVAFFSSSIERDDWSEHFGLSEGVHLFQGKNFSIEEIRELIKIGHYDVLIFDSIVPLLTDVDSKKIYYRYYRDIYNILDSLSYKEKMDIYLCRQLPADNDIHLPSIDDAEEFEKRANALYGLTRCHSEEEGQLTIQAKELHTGEMVTFRHTLA